MSDAQITSQALIDPPVPAGRLGVTAVGIEMAVRWPG